MSNLITVLIADDLTGSLDSIAPFAALGMHCVTAVSLAALGPALACGPDVLAVNLGTRELSPDLARARAATATRAVQAATGPETVWIKKIDSRLKGQIAAEIAGMADVLHLKHVLICPAIPDLGRFVSQGYLTGHGVAQDLSLADTVILDLPCTFPDATTDADLDRLVGSIPPDTLVAAARGLVGALARRMRPHRLPAVAQIQQGPIGFAIGSRDPVTLEQVALVQVDGGPQFIMAPDGDVLTPEDLGPFLIQATPGAGAKGHVVTARLAAGVTQHVGGLKTLVLTGGETAAAVLDAAGIQILRVRGEVLPGLPLCHVVDRAGFPDLITKSGGFGQPDTLLRLWQAAQHPEGTS